MRIALIADAYPPVRTSAAVQLRDLSAELARQGHEPVVMIPDSSLNQPWASEKLGEVHVLRLRAPRTKDIGYVRRTLNEFLMPFFMRRNLRKSPYGDVCWEGVVWYSPTIFLGPFVRALKMGSGCRSYLIVRDIFPEWAVDMGLMGRGLPYLFFKGVERFQYSVADVIGVQAAGNLAYFDEGPSRSGQRVEVLHNWLAPAQNVGCTISVSDTPLAGRKIFVYAGNMGVAQGMPILLDLAESLLERQDIGFLFVGRGSHVKELRDNAQARGLDNVVFHDEIDPSEISGLYAQCHVGIVALDPRHKTHNIPGKFLSYMQAGLPVLARINPGNDLEHLINAERVGRVCTDQSVDELRRLAQELADEVASGEPISLRCHALFAKLFLPDAAVRQISAALQG